MFIESRSQNFSYSNFFFAEYKSNSCSYTLIEKSNIVYVITILLGLYRIIAILIPSLMHRLYKFIKKFHQRNSQVIPF